MSVEAILHGQSYTRPQEDALLAEKQDSKVLTLAEYNALPAADKTKDIVYFITDDEIPSSEIYSKSEVDAIAQELENSMAILANGDTHAAITQGQYVYVRNHSTLADGLYKATANIAANGTLSTSNVSAVSGGGLNDVKTSYYDTVSSGASKTITLSPTASVWLLACGNPGNNDLLGAWVVVPGTTLGTGQARKLGGTSYLTVSVAGTEVTLSNSSSATLRIGLVKMA